MKKILVLCGIAVLTLGAFAHGGHRGPRWCPPPPHHHHHHSVGGFWSGFVGGVVGGAVVGAALTPRTETVVVAQPAVVSAPVVVQPQPVVVQQPVVQQQVVVQPQTVWVEGRYVDQVQANGSVVRVWQPGHYEQR